MSSSAPTPVDASIGGRALVVSTSSQFVAKGVHLVLNVVISVVLIRYLGPTGYGEYVLVVATVGLLGVVSDFGLTKLAVRDVARDERSTGTVLGTVVVMRLATGVVAALAVQLALLALTDSSKVHWAAGVASGVYLAEAALTVTVVFHARVEQQYDAAVRIIMEVVELVAVLVVVSTAASLAAVMATPLVGAGVGAVIAWWLARSRTPFRLHVDRALLRTLAREALVVGPIALIGVAYLKLDALLVSIVLGAHELGLYGAAYQPIEYLLLASAVLVNVLFALLVRFSPGEPSFTAIYRNGAASLLALFLPVPITMMFAAPDVISIAFGPGYAASTGPLRVLSWALLPLALQAWQGFVLLAAGWPRTQLPILLAGIVANVMIDIVLLRWIGVVGAAWGTLLTSLGLVVATTAATARRASSSLSPSQLLAVAAAGAGFTGATAVLTTALPAPAALALASPVYVWLLHRTKVVDLVTAATSLLRTRPAAAPTALP